MFNEMPNLSSLNHEIIDDEEFLHGTWLSHPSPGEEVVITGLAGMFPESKNVRELQKNLYSGVNMVTDNDRRWNCNHPEISSKSGTIPDIKKFDAGFFGIHYRQTNSMDPTIRLSLEKAVEAIVDAGYNPSEIEGTRTGVFVGACQSESEIHLWSKMKPQEFVITGAIRGGTCDQALVIGVNVLLHPFVTVQLARAGVSSKEGACKVFDINGDGYIRSEAVGILFLQKSKDARRVYAQIVHSKTNVDGFKQQGILFPSSESQTLLMRSFYKECAIKPSDVSYLEAHATATVVGDPEEANAIDNVFCAEPGKSVLVGSVKSNIGHCEPASGVSSVVKAIITMENGVIPSVINFTAVRPEIKGFESGRLKLVTKNLPLQDDRGLIAINNFGFGGANGHVLLRWNNKTKQNEGKPHDNLPRLVCVSGRTPETITMILDDVNDRTLDAEYVKLYHQVHSKEFKGHFHRGYTIATKTGEVHREIQQLIEPKPLFLFMGICGNDLGGIAKHLSQFPTFAATTKKINDLLASKMRKELLSDKLHGTSSVFKNMLSNMSIQIAIIDILKQVGVKPRKVLGFGLGEFLCGYFENCLTLEQVVWCVYHVALWMCSTAENPNIYVVSANRKKLGLLDLADICVKEIDCNTVIITGNPKNLKILKDSLINQGVEVRNFDNAQGHHLDENSETQLLIALQSIIRHPKQKTWVSCCSNDTEASASYFVQSLRGSFTPGTHFKTPPKNAVVLKIGTGQFESDYVECDVLSFEKRDESEDVFAFLKVLGRLFNIGQNLDLAQIYPKVEYPVSRTTPMISPCIEWQHSKEWYVFRYKPHEAPESREFSRYINLQTDEWSYLKGHLTDGRNFLRVTAYIDMVWNTLAIKHKLDKINMKVVFESIRFLTVTTLQKDQEPLQFMIMIHSGSGNFEVTENNVLVVTGQVYTLDDVSKERVLLDKITTSANGVPWLSERDIYKELKLRGYNYAGHFKGIKKCNVDAASGLIQWNDNWVSYMENMLQLATLQKDTRWLCLPVSIQKIVIDPYEHLSITRSLGVDKPLIPIQVQTYRHCQIIRSGGVEIQGLAAQSTAQRRINAEPVLEKYVFVPNETKLRIDDAIVVNVQLVSENLFEMKMKLVEMVTDETGQNWKPLAPKIQQVLSNTLMMVRSEIIVVSKKSLNLPSNVSAGDKDLTDYSDCSVVVGPNILANPKTLVQCLSSVKSGGYVLSRHSLQFDLRTVISTENIDILTVHATEKEILILAKKSSREELYTVIDVSDEKREFSWLPKVQQALNRKENVIVYAQNDFTNGILGFTNGLRREPGIAHVKCFFINDSNAPVFDLQNPFYRDQLEKDLVINIYQDSRWGTYRHLLLGELEPINAEHCFATNIVPGDLSTFSWMEGPLKNNSTLKPSDELIYVYYSSLNFRDVMVCSGKFSLDMVTTDRTKQEVIQGIEFCGRTANGRRVMGLTQSGAHASLVATDSSLLFTVPDEWSMEEGASVMAVYSTLIYGMFMRTHLVPGETILIHSGTDNVSLAAITLALHYELMVFTTVGTGEEREYMRKTFPCIPDNHIGSSRDTSFEQMIFKESRGRGVDIVLNSLTEDKLEASIRCLAKGGRFLETGKFDSCNDIDYPQSGFLKKEASFHGITIDKIINAAPEIKLQFAKIMRRVIASGAIKPLTTTVFEKDDIEMAFRLMSTGKHIGKVLLKYRDEESNRNAIPVKTLMRATPRYFCDPSRTYVILGGLGGFGLELADWLVLRGATKLTLSSRTGIKTGYQAYRLRSWKNHGIQVKISNDDITTYDGCRELLKSASRMGPVAAIFNLAMVLQDALLENQTPHSFNNCFAPKAYATEHLDKISRTMCPELKDFVVFSSFSGSRGNAGQTNYGMANSVMERICERRKLEGLPALAIEWGAVGDVGIVAESQEDDVEIIIGGTLQQRISSCLQVLDVLLRQNKYAIVTSMVVAELKSGANLGDNLVEVVANIIGIRNLKTVSMQATLSELGIDSMMAIEVRQTLAKEFQVILSTQDIRSMTFARLHEIQENLTVEEEAGTKTEHVNILKNIEGLIDCLNEKQPYSKFVQLKTKADPSAAPNQVCFFPGLEGVSTILEPLAANLNVNATSLQFCYESPKSNIREIALNLLSTVERLLAPDEPFRFVAYSQGVAIALELIEILERKGRRGHLLVVDSGPELVSYMKWNNMFNSNSAFETEFCCQFMSHIVSYKSISNIKEALLKSENFVERLSLCEKVIPKDNGSHFKEHLKELMTAACRRVQVLADYNPSFKIKSSIKLCKPTKLLHKGLSEDYKLSDVCDGIVGIKVLEGDHISILENKELVEIINQFALLQ